MGITGFDPTTGLPLINGQKAAPNPYAQPGASAPVAPSPPQGQAPPPFATMTPGNSPAYGTQSPTMFGTGTYTAPLLPINDEAITGAPAQGASTNYGLNSVWDNLNKELAAAPNQGAGMATATLGGPASYTAATGQATQAQAAQGGYATAAPTALATSGNTIANQANLARTLDIQANGGGVSPADLQLQQGEQAGVAAQLAALGSQRGGTNAALAQRAAQDQAAAAAATTNQTLGIQRAQETQAAQQAEGAVLGAQGSQAAGINATAAGLQQQTELANAANAQQSTVANTENAQQTALTNAAAANAMTGQNLSAVNAANTGNAQLSQAQELANLGYSNQDTLANQQTQLANQQLQNQQQAAVLGAQTAIGESNKASSLADEQLQLQQLIAANQVNEQGYQASAGANANLTGAVVGAAGSLIGAGITAAGAGGAGAAGGGASGSGLNLFSGTQAVTPGATNPYYTSSDENLKTGIEGGNPMMRSFLQSYKDSTTPAAAINVTEGSRFRNPSFGKAAGSASAGGGGIGSAIGGVLGGVAGAFVGAPALGAAAGGAIGGAVGSGIDPATTTGGGNVMTGQGSGVTVDESGWGQLPQAAPPGMAMSDENEKDAVTGGNRGMQAFLQQANQQTSAQNNSGAQSNSFMQTGAPPTATADTQMPYGGDLPPFMQGQGGVGYGMPQPGSGGGISGGGITNYGGYTGATMGDRGGVGRPPWEAQYDPADASAVQSLAAAHPQPMATAANLIPANASAMPAAKPVMPLTFPKQNPAQPLANSIIANAAPQFAFGGQWGVDQNPGGLVGAALGAASALSDENEKVKTGNGGDVQAMLDQLTPYAFRYKNPNAPGAMPGKRLGVMAQELEDSPLGKQFVRETPQGKMVDYGSMAGTQLAASAMLNERLDQHEAMLKALAGARR